MSKGKKRGGQQPALNPAIRLSGLRQRLEALLIGEDDPRRIEAEVERLTDGLKPAAFLPVLLSAFAGAAPAKVDALGEGMPGWLGRRGYLAPLRDLVTRGGLAGEAQDLALRWLGAASVDVAAIQAAAAPVFYQAYRVGNEHQAALAIFWHANAQQRRVRGMSFLLDFEPPWHGALKDVAVIGQRNPDQMIADYLALWDSRGDTPAQISAAEALGELLGALAQSRAQDIRLPADLLPAREQFLSMLRALPAGPAASFGAADFDAMAKTGRSPEALNMTEKLTGYQTRLPSGESVRLLPADFDDDD